MEITLHGSGISEYLLTKETDSFGQGHVHDGQPLKPMCCSLQAGEDSLPDQNNKDNMIKTKVGQDC